jgi:hypothetical protein
MGDETWVAIVEHLAATAESAQALEENLRRRYPDAVVEVSGLEGLTRPVWTVYKRRRRR